jgi:hypothetical protein
MVTTEKMRLISRLGAALGYAEFPKVELKYDGVKFSLSMEGTSSGYKDCQDVDDMLWNYIEVLRDRLKERIEKLEDEHKDQINRLKELLRGDPQPKK